MGFASWDNPEEFLEDQADQYHKDFWSHQPRRIEVWIEKQGRVGAVMPVLREYGVDHIAMGGWGSKDAVYRAAQRIATTPEPYTILYLGDYDPSGMRMSETDLPERLRRYGAGEKDVLVRVAVTKADTRGLTSFPASDKGPRFQDGRRVKGDPNYPWFVERYGHRCWELDAMRPSVMRSKLERAIRSRIELESWARCEVVAQAEYESLKEYLAAWPGMGDVA